MKLGIDAHKYALPRQTGTERYSSAIIEHLLKEAGKDRLTLYVSRPPTKTFGSSVLVRRIRHLKFIWPWTYFGLSLELYRHPVDVLFVPAHELPLYHPRAVVTLHDVAYRKFPEAYGRGQRTRLEWSTRRTVRRAWRIVTISEATRRDLVDLYGADPAKIRVIYPGPLPERTASVDREKAIESLRRLRLEPERYFFYVGRIEEKKNLRRLIQAFNAGKKSGDLSWRLVLAGGPGPGAERIDQLIRKLGLEADVIRPGYVSDELKAELMALAGGLVLPSLYEGFGFPILEAFQARVPVVASSGGSIPEVAGDAALLCPPIDTEAFKKALVRIESDPKLRTELIEKGLAQAKKFSWDTAAKELWRVFREAS